MSPGIYQGLCYYRKTVSMKTVAWGVLSSICWWFNADSQMQTNYGRSKSRSQQTLKKPQDADVIPLLHIKQKFIDRIIVAIVHTPQLFSKT